MVESRCDHRLPLVALSSRSTSAVVRYSRVRRSALGRRVGVTVLFSAVGVISRRWDLAKVFTLFGGCCSDDGHFSNSVTPGGSRRAGPTPTGGTWTGPPSRARQHVRRKYLGPIF